MKKFFALLLALCMLASLAACGQAAAPTESAATETAAPAAEEAPAEETAGPVELTLANSFAYASADVHLDYNGWFTAIYGASEALFYLDDNSSVQPCLAENAEVDDSGLVWTVKLNPNACFSNGVKLTADMVKRNLERLAEVNARFAYLGEFSYEVIDEETLSITTVNRFPTLLNELAAPECGIMDLDDTTDTDLAPIYTGPFVITSFEPEGTVVVEKNENYWNGMAKVDKITFLYMQDDDAKQLAMQNGEIDGYNTLPASAAEIFAAAPEHYTLTTVPATRLQFFAINHRTLNDNMRKAILSIIDKDAIVAFFDGTVSATDGPFAANKAYGKVTAPGVDVELAKQLIESEGYALNANGFYEKDGKELNLSICYYAARGLDAIATIMQDQLRAAGVNSTLRVEEDPDATYIPNGDYDLGLYCSIADKSCDPYYIIDELFRSTSRFNSGYANAEVDALIDELEVETDASRRAELANEIVQKVVDGSDYGFIGLFNKITVSRAGVSGISENSPFDFYFATVDTAVNG